ILPAPSAPIWSTALQVMGPEATYNISTSKVMLAKLASDGSNWSLYQEWVLNALTSKKL
ncbi:hypothetical protein DXG03_001282, partial [Asterophora parasitica]